MMKSLGSNGTLLDFEKVEFMRDNEISVMGSLHGPKEIHDAQRLFKKGQVSYDIIGDNCKNLLQAKPDYPCPRRAHG